MAPSKRSQRITRQAKSMNTNTPEAPQPDEGTESGPQQPDILGYATVVAFTFVVTLAAYCGTMYPGLPPGDAGELITAAHQLSGAHPPGYPLFTLLGGLSSRILPFWSVAFKVNLMCSVFGATAAAALAAAAIEFTGVLWAGVLSGLAFGLSRDVWFYSLQAEVFALNNLLVALVLLLTIKYFNTRARWVALAGAFVIGLGLSNQHTILVLAVPMVLSLVSIGHKQLFEPLTAAALVLCGLLGLLPYAWMWFNGAPAVKFGWGDLSTAAGFFRHLLRSEYGTFQLVLCALHK